MPDSLPKLETDFPLSPDGGVSQPFISAAGDCWIRRRAFLSASSTGATNFYCGTDNGFLALLADSPRACAEGDCIDLGDFDWEFLFNGSSCYR